MARTFQVGVTNRYGTTSVPSRTGALGLTLAIRVRLTAWGNTGYESNNVVGPLLFIKSSADSYIWIYSDSFYSPGNFFFGTQVASFSVGYDEIDVPGFSLNTWYHIAMVIDGSGNIQPYVNGVATSGTPLSGGTGIGAWTALSWNEFGVGSGIGMSQDACFFDTPLSAAEVAQLALSSQPLTRTALLAQYPLFSDSPLADFSGNGRTLSTSGTVTAGTSPHAPASWGGGRTQRLFIPAASGTNITAAGTTQVTGAATITAAASAASAGTTQVTGAASVTSGASAAAAGTTRVTGAATVTAGASAASTGTTQTTGAASLSATASAASVGTTQVTGTATILALFPAAASGSTQVTGTAIVTSSAGGSIAASGTTQTTGAATVTAGASAASSGSTQVTGAAAVTSSASAASTGTTQVTGAATVTAGASAAAVGSTQVTGAAVIQASFPAAAGGSTQVTGIAFVTSSAPGPSSPAGDGSFYRRFATSHGRRRAR